MGKGEGFRKYKERMEVEVRWQEKVRKKNLDKI